MLDAIAISDLHLGSDNCQAEALVQFLEAIRFGDVPTRRIILNGDVFDSIDFRRLKKHHWKVLSLIRKMADEVEIVWINGNHDGPSDIVSHLLGVTVVDEFLVVSGGKRVLFLHGHRFDAFLEKHRITTWFADWVYRMLQKIDPTHGFARWAKQSSKLFLRCTAKIEAESISYAETKDCDAVCCGHTHLAVANRNGPIEYFNSGCWTEKPCHYLTVENGFIDLKSYHESPAVVDRPQLAAVSA
ncbi:UDP-2,3-diacylglucosamine diphosphatase [Limnoglobus roseus]|uniref:UDP-2,3-diacylglucosamine diphosphatase n=1 Tax=Limnoglobus roseus TaxID=2598579 RepID=A0A5C1AG50_9BACT|nr:UDP-2,3-diacylglucosamine diphosphatase [Limnoglobus roseus]QEL16966.1 UDP-2,3-diacylglucosamine diphosphatase [Limnoglobus roseus]